MMDHDRADRMFSAVPGFVFMLLLAFCVAALQAQTAQSTSRPPAAQPTERPGDIYKELMQPLDQVRSSLDNWSPAELAALAAGIKRAQEYCGQVAPGNVGGDDLYQLARVCSVGQRWNDADAAASAYIKSASQPYQAHAYAIRINALLNLKDTTMAAEVARSMLRSVPYDATVDQSMAYLIHYLAMSLDDGALPLARERQPFLLTAVESGSALKEQPGDISIGIAALYDEGLVLAYLEQYASRQSDAQRTVAALDAAVSVLPTDKIDNQAEIDRAKAQYALLGEKLPRIQIFHYAAPGNPHPHINPDYGAATVLLMFPEWCAHCRKMMQPLSDFLVRNSTEKVHTYGLLALNEDETTADPFKDDRFKDLLQTPILTTSSATLQSFGAVSFPFVVITDGTGRIRFLGTVSQNAFDAGGFVEEVIDRSAGKGASKATPSPGR
jgi:tetratricopeptide (TPR) repeat protein